MTRKSILLGLGAIGALVLAGNAGAQIVGGAGGTVGGAVGGVTGQGSAAGQVAAPMPATPAVPATPAIPSAASAGADASATARGRSDFPAGMVVRDSAGVQIGTVMDPDPSMTASGRVTIKTGTGFITVPRGSLTIQGDVAVSKQTEADLRASGKTRTE
ncbi:MAG: hypothetical protein HY859_07545 [Caulobacterales bacterium]|nr:hypothetical protein [Caulobacterales bacterium]